MPVAGVKSTRVSFERCADCATRRESGDAALRALAHLGTARGWAWRMWQGKTLVTNAPLTAWPGVRHGWTWGVGVRPATLPVVFGDGHVEHWEFAGLRMEGEAG